jgi:hypothetical protein
MYLVCDIDNPIGVHLAFYTDDAGRCIARFRPKLEHQGFSGQLHGALTQIQSGWGGGVIAATGSRPRHDCASRLSTISRVRCQETLASSAAFAREVSSVR